VCLSKSLLRNLVYIKEGAYFVKNKVKGFRIRVYFRDLDLLFNRDSGLTSGRQLESLYSVLFNVIDVKIRSNDRLRFNFWPYTH
jgi:hypothetical protein